MASEEYYDVLIVGGGPAGCSCAIALAGSGLRVALLEKDHFPREKVCGDALGWDVVGQMKQLPAALYMEFELCREKLPVYGFEIASPGHYVLRKSLRDRFHGDPAGYIMRRELFDSLLLNMVQHHTTTSVFTGMKVHSFEYDADRVVLYAGQRFFKGRIAVGADGMSSIFRKHVKEPPTGHHDNWIACRTYFRDVPYPEGDAAIEFHFIRESLPGYFWIFPGYDGISNVGTGLPLRVLKQKGITIHRHFELLLDSRSYLSRRLRGAAMTGAPEACPIPMYHGRRSISGDRFILAGDAASLVNPLTGEGIGNAIRSGRLAAEHIERCFMNNEFSASANRRYDREIYRRMGPGLRLSGTLKRTLTCPQLIDFIIKYAATNRVLKQWLLSIFNKM